eukprot:gene26202-11932_t
MSIVIAQGIPLQEEYLGIPSPTFSTDVTKRNRASQLCMSKALSPICDIIFSASLCDTTMDLNKYKLTPQQLERRKEQCVSKNRLVISAEKKKSLQASAGSSPSPGDAAHAAHAPINYGAVAQMLGYGQSRDTSPLPDNAKRSTHPAIHSTEGRSAHKDSTHSAGETTERPPPHPGTSSPYPSEFTLAPGVNLADLVEQAKQLEQRQQLAYDTALGTFTGRGARDQGGEGYLAGRGARDQGGEGYLHHTSRAAMISTTSTPSKNSPADPLAPKGWGPSPQLGQTSCSPQVLSKDAESPIGLEGSQRTGWQHWEPPSQSRFDWSDQGGQGEETHGSRLTMTLLPGEAAKAQPSLDPRGAQPPWPSSARVDSDSSGCPVGAGGAQPSWPSSTRVDCDSSGCPVGAGIGADTVPSQVVQLMEKQAKVEARLAEIELRGGSDSYKQQEEMHELRSAMREMREDNAIMRFELNKLQSHTSSMMSALQTQVAQLLRQVEGGGSIFTDLPAPTARPSTSMAPSRPAFDMSIPFTETARQRAQPPAAAELSGIPLESPGPLVIELSYPGHDYPGHGGAHHTRSCPVTTTTPWSRPAQRRRSPGRLGRPVPRDAARRDRELEPVDDQGAPVTNVEDDLDELPSYSAFRRGVVSGTPTATTVSASATFNPAPPPRYASTSVTITPSPSAVRGPRPGGQDPPCKVGGASPRPEPYQTFTRTSEPGPYDGVGDGAGGGGAPQAAAPTATAAAPQLPGRSLPSQYVGRSIGGTSILAQSHIRDMADPTPLPSFNTMGRATQAHTSGTAQGGKPTPNSFMGPYSPQPVIFTRAMGGSGEGFGGGGGGAEYGLVRAMGAGREGYSGGGGAEYGVTRHKDAENSMSLAAHTVVAKRVQAKRQVPSK